MSRLLLVILIGVNFSVANSGSIDNFLLEDRKFSYEGHVFFNATNSSSQGEKYLLNQQLSNVKLGSEYQFSNWNKIKGLVIYNTLPTPIAPNVYFEQLYGENKNESSDWGIEAGRKWVAFGNYKNDLIYKPYTKALGQTNESTIVMAYDSFYYMNLSLYQPFSRVKSLSLPFYYNIAMGVHNRNYDIGSSYIQSIAESQLFQYNKGFGGFLKRTIQSEVPGLAAYFNFKYNQWSAYITYVESMRPFNPQDLSYNNRGAQPRAFSIQSGYEFEYRNTLLKLIGFYDHSFETLALRLAKKRVGLGLSAFPTPYLSLQFQYFQEFGYPEEAVGSGFNTRVSKDCSKMNNFALQAIYNF